MKKNHPNYEAKRYEGECWPIHPSIDHLCVCLFVCAHVVEWKDEKNWEPLDPSLLLKHDKKRFGFGVSKEVHPISSAHTHRAMGRWGVLHRTLSVCLSVCLHRLTSRS